MPGVTQVVIELALQGTSSSISCGIIIAATLFLSPSGHTQRMPGGLGRETEILTGVLEAQCATRQGQGPGARLAYGLTSQRGAGVGGQPPRSLIPRSQRHRETPELAHDRQPAR